MRKALFLLGFLHFHTNERPAVQISVPTIACAFGIVTRDRFGGDHMKQPGRVPVLTFHGERVDERHVITIGRRGDFMRCSAATQDVADETGHREKCFSHSFRVLWRRKTRIGRGVIGCKFEVKHAVNLPRRKEQLWRWTTRA